MIKGMTEHMNRYRLKRQAGFTLLELMATLVVLAIIIAIAVPAIGKLTAKADASADKSSIALMERAGEMAYIDDLKTDDAAPVNPDKPASITEKDVYTIPTLVESGYLKLDDVSKFNKAENYVKKVNKSGKFIYMGKGANDSGAGNGGNPVDVGSCTRDGSIELDNWGDALVSGGIYKAETHYTWKQVDRNVRYSSMTMDASGDYVAFGQFGKQRYYPRVGIAVDKYNKDMKLVDTFVLEYKGDTQNHPLFSSLNSGSGATSIIQNQKGQYVVSDGSTLHIFGENLEYEDTISVSNDNAGLLIDRVVQNDTGDYFVAGVSGKNLTVLSYSDKFNFKDELVIESHSGTIDSSDVAVHDFLLLKNGDLLLAGDEYYKSGFTRNYYSGYDERGRLLRITDDLSIKHEFTLASDYGRHHIQAVAELSDGTIAAHTGENGGVNSGNDVFTVRTFTADLSPYKEKSYSNRYDDFYDHIVVDLYSNGNTFSTPLHGYMFTYDKDLNEVKKESLSTSPFDNDYPVSMKDGDAYITFDTDGTHPEGINKIKRFSTAYHTEDGYVSDDDFVWIGEEAPRAIHTAPPRKSDIDGFDVTPEPDGGNSGLPPGFLGAAYVLGYNAATNSVNPVYAGTVLMQGDITQGAPDAVYAVESNGKLRAIDFGNMSEDDDRLLNNPNSALFIVSVDFSSMNHMAYSGPVPAGAVLVDVKPEEEEVPEEEGSEISIDPCYSGAFIIQIDDMKMYRVQDDGALSRVSGDPYTATPEDFGYDVYEHALFYLYPNGRIVSYPDIRQDYTES